MTEVDKSALPPLPPDPYSGDGYDWMDALKGGWHVVSAWGVDGWDLGQWPYVLVAHYSNDAIPLYGRCIYVEGDICELQAFGVRKYRDEATTRTAVWYWKHYDTPTAPKDEKDPRVGPYRGLLG